MAIKESEVLASENIGKRKLKQAVTEFIAACPECPEGFFEGRYVDLKFNWLPFVKRSGERVIVGGPGFADAVLDLLAKESIRVVAMFVRSWAEASRKGSAVDFMQMTFGVPWQGRNGSRITVTLRAAREHRGLSERQAAYAAGIDVRTLRRWEQDCRNASGLKFIRLVHGVYRLSIDCIHIGAAHEFKEAVSRDAAQ